MLVSDVMTKDVRTANPAGDLQEVAASMCLNRLSGMPVVNDNEELIGFVAERDILHSLFPKLEDLMDNSAITDFQEMEGHYGALMNLKVEDVMTPGVISVRTDTPLLKAVSTMVRHKFRRIPVADNGKCLGIISIGDAHKALFKDNLKLSS